ncbi:oxidoreductase [Hypoxylon sp. FL1284]|nr:oxidoreductase [Hypoxylon sp. FL1284]
MAQQLQDGQALPVMLCLHGHGTNGAFFAHQARNLTRALRQRFRFEFVESPIETSQPGLGMLPHFADVRPYRRWHHDAGAVGSFDVTADDAARERALVRDVLAAKISELRPVGIMAFSHGTSVAASLCRDPELGAGIRFAFLICGLAGLLPLGDESEEGGGEGKKLLPLPLDLPTVQAQGDSDLWAAKAARLAKRSIFDPERARVVKFRGKHEVPVAMADVTKITREVIAMYEALPPA